MFSKFICVKFLNTGRCDNKACSLRHVNDITSLEVSSKMGSNGKTEESKGDDGSWEKVKKRNAKLDSHVKPGSIAASDASEISIKSRHKMKTEKAILDELLDKGKTYCPYLLERGTCRMKDRCFYSHDEALKLEAEKRASLAKPISLRTDRGGMRGGFRGGFRGGDRGGIRGGRGGLRGGPTEDLGLRGRDWERPRTTFFDPSLPVASLSGLDPLGPPSYRGRRRTFRGGRGGFGGRDRTHLEDATSKVVKLQQQDDPVNYEEFDRELKRTYKDLVRLEPIRRALFSGKELDMMFIIDCTGSMGSWIEACKKEIKSIIDCVRNQHFNIQIKVSIVAYRDHCDGNLISEVLPFTNDIA
jgi:hypothetical protein